MTFNDGLFDIDSLTNPLEAAACVYFLDEEIARHQHERLAAMFEAKNHRSLAGDYHKALASLYDSAVYRHEQGIEATEAKRNEVQRRWSIV